VATFRHSLETEIPFSDCQLRRIAKTGELRNLNFQLAHLEFSHLLAWSTAPISYPQIDLRFENAAVNSEFVARYKLLCRFIDGDATAYHDCRA
jgi:hypothetical protein